MRRLLCFLLGLLLTTAQLYAQNRTVSGTLVDSSGKSIPGASVKVTNSKLGTTTDERGNFRLTIPTTARNLEFTSVGFVQQIVVIPASGSMLVTMKQDNTRMNEVVVTGITTTTRSKYTGAATKINEKAIADKPVGSFDQILQGRVPGVTSLTSSGQPGTSATIIIRGQGSIEGGFTPLYVIDGIPVEAQVFQGLNPNDFESIDILRDNAAAALYGSRGSSGVIVVTTKRGKSGKFTIGYGGQFGQKTRPEFTWDMMTTAELLKSQHDYGSYLAIPGSANALPGWYYAADNPINAGLTQAQKDRNKVILDSMGQINTDWRDVFFRDGKFQNHQITISGGTGKTRLYSSVAFYNEEGTTLRTDMKRGTWRTNLDYGDDKLTLAINSNIAYTKRNFQQSTANASTGNPFLVANITAPYSKLYLRNDTLATGTGNKFAGANTYETTTLDMNYNDQIKVTLGTTANYRITNNITAGLVAGVDFRETQASNYGNRLAYIRRTSSTPTGRAGFQLESLTRFFNADIRPSLGYHKVVNDKHDFDVTAYGEWIMEANKSTSGTGYGIDPRLPNTPAAITQGNGVNQLYAVVGGSKSEIYQISGLVIGRYTYNSKYTFTGSFRSDGSSKLPEDTRWQKFWSLGGVWEMTKEDFLKNSSFVNTLRLKASYGGSGNYDNFPGGAYPYQPTYGTGDYSGLPTQAASYPGYDQMKWETTWITNIGVDFSIWKGKIYGDFNVYDKTTKDLFVTKQLSATSGFGGLLTNAGELKNKGVELALNYDLFRTKDVLITLNGNFGYNKNEITSLGGETSYEQGTEKLIVGMPLGTHYEIKWGGVDAATGAPLYYDANGQLTNDYALGEPVSEFGTWEAPWKGGFGGSIRYKSFEVSTLFAWQHGAFKYDNLAYFMENPNGFLAGGWNQGNTMHFWQKPGDIVNTPSPLYNVNFSSQFIHNADFLRWKDLMVSYTVPQSILTKAKFISNARVFIQGTNLHIWTPWKGMDPEAGATNLNLNEFPNPRAVTAGLDISF